MADAAEPSDAVAPNARHVPVPFPLIDDLERVTQDCTSCRFVAVYPVSFKSIAVNDGSFVSLKSDPPLHERLGELLKNERRVCWMIYDRERRACYIGDVGEAQTWLSRNVPQTKAE
jgi:hypothetical protein